MKLTAQGLGMTRGAFRLSADFQTPLDGVTVLFGPSGAGKSVLLSAIAGLTRLHAGRLIANDVVLEDAAGRIRVPAHEREIGLLFQDARLFPHLTVRDNLAYAHKRAARNHAPPDIDAIAGQLDISSLLARSVRNLSGGEKGRVALARALLSAPRLLMLDEPFAALDSRRRRAFLTRLRMISVERRLPLIVVTHQVEDAAELADHVIAMREGQVIVQGPASAAMQQPAFQDLLDPRDMGARVDAHAIPGVDMKAGGVWVRADNVMLASEAPRALSARNVWAGAVADMTRETDGSVLVAVEASVGRVLARITADASNELGVALGRPIWAIVKTQAL
jgi:molybdate transport system ATP-binding protein